MHAPPCFHNVHLQLQNFVTVRHWHSTSHLASFTGSQHGVIRNHEMCAEQWAQEKTKWMATANRPPLDERFGMDVHTIQHLGKWASLESSAFLDG